MVTFLMTIVGGRAPLVVQKTYRSKIGAQQQKPVDFKGPKAHSCPHTWAVWDDPPSDKFNILALGWDLGCFSTFFHMFLSLFVRMKPRRAWAGSLGGHLGGSAEKDHVCRGGV